PHPADRDDIGPTLAMGPQGGVLHPGLAGVCRLAHRAPSLRLARAHGGALAVCGIGLAAVGLRGLAFCSGSGAQARHPAGGLTMLKLIVPLLIVVLIWWLLPRARHRSGPQRATRPAQAPGASSRPEAPAPDVIVQC